MTPRRTPLGLDWLDAALTDLDRADLRRTRVTRTGPMGPTVEIDGRTLLNFAANDYLALAGDPRLAAAARAAADAAGWGAGASPLVAGYTAAHAALERRLAQFEQTEAAVVFGSGFAANLGSIAALVERGDAVFSDELNHASLIDGCRLSRADVAVYRHADVDHLAELLEAARGARRRLIVTDGLFSMDGDLAPLAALVELAERHGAMLLVDEAHATGVFGPTGRGAAEALGVAERVAVRMGTLSKALASLGGFVAGSQSLAEWLVNRARSYVFATALPPAVAAAAAAALDVVRDEPQRRVGLLERAAWLRAALVEQGWDVGRSASQIVPVIVGPPGRAVELAARLRAAGLLVPAIRPPSVPAGQARLRISLSSGHTAAMVEQLASELRRLR